MVASGSTMIGRIATRTCELVTLLAYDYPWPTAASLGSFSYSLSDTYTLS